MAASEKPGAPPAKAEFEAVQKTRVYEKVAEQIQRMICDGLLKSGDKLPPERELAEMFQVSRASLRDAIRTLELLGLVEPRQGEGTVVRDLSVEKLIQPLSSILLGQRKLVRELLEFREMIEPGLAGRAAVNASPEDVARLEEIIERQNEKAGRGEAAIEEDSEFHYAIAQAGKNSVVLKFVDIFMDLLRESREQSMQLPGRLQRSIAGHRRILAAIIRHDSAAAETAMRRHIKEIEEIILEQARQS